MKSACSGDCTTKVLHVKSLLDPFTLQYCNDSLLYIVNTLLYNTKALHVKSLLDPFTLQYCNDSNRERSEHYTVYNFGELR
jgi:hypothetical protein